MKKKLYIHAVILLWVTSNYAQSVPINSNSGMFYVSPETVVVSVTSLENFSTGEIYNDGDFYMRSNLHNDGVFSFSKKRTSGYTVFESSSKAEQLISGDKPTDLYDVLFNKLNTVGDIELKNQLSISGTANFHQGILRIQEEERATIHFQKGSKAINASDKSYVEGKVLKIGNHDFGFPVGKKGHYGYAGMAAPKKTLTAIQAEYFYANSNDLASHKLKTGVIEVINDQEYWEIKNTNNDEMVVLTLGWNGKTIAPSFLENEAKGLGIVRWDNEEKLWIPEGGIVDLGNKTVTLPVAVSKYGLFTLGKLKTDLILSGDVVIYNAVSANGDGNNDYFRIENLDRFPDNKVTIFNRWGVLVYETTNYGAHDNVFRGISEGKGTLKKGEGLPTGTYYYILEYDYKDQNGSNRIKKAGYLHLENN